MTKVEGSPSSIHKWSLSSGWLVFTLVLITIVSLIVETGIVRVTGFVGSRDLTFEIAIFVGLGVFCALSQLIILNYVRNRVGKSYFSNNHTRMYIMNKALISIQLAIIALLVVVLLEVLLTLSYHTILIKAVLVGSFLTASGLMAFLSWRFVVWIKSNNNRLMVVYLLSSIFVLTSAIVGVIYFLDQLAYQPDVIYPKGYSDYLTRGGMGNSSLVYFYSISSAIAFVLLWMGTVFMLGGYAKKLGRWKYWILMSLPLLYFLSQFQPVILNFLLSYVADDPILFSLVYVSMVDASRPIGGVLFGLAFIFVARKLQNQELKGYMVISGIGFLLLLVSYEAQALITAPFPPLGLLSGSYFGLASYLILIGLYSSAVSISLDSKLRVSIRRSIESEVRFLESIGEAEMDHRIVDKVLATSKKFSKVLSGETGSPSSLTDEEIKEYIEDVLAEVHKKS